MDDLVQWLHAQLDEDERTARAATPGPWVANKHKYGAEVYTESGEGVALDHDAGGVGWDDADFIAANDPARVLREIDAKRQVIKAFTVSAERMEELAEERERLKVRGYDTLMTEMDLTTAIHQRDVLGGVLQLFALPYADRPGYRDEWRP